MFESCQAQCYEALNVKKWHLGQICTSHLSLLRSWLKFNTDITHMTKTNPVWIKKLRKDCEFNDVEISRESISIKDCRISCFLAYLPAASPSRPSHSIDADSMLKKVWAFRWLYGAGCKRVSSCSSFWDEYIIH